MILLPGTELATSAQVASFYEIDINTIRALVRNNREELESDGLHFLNYTGIKAVIELPPNLNEMNALGINRAGTNVFTKRALFPTLYYLVGRE